METRIMNAIDTINQNIARISGDLDQVGTALSGISTDAAAIIELLKNNPSQSQLDAAATQLAALGDRADAAVAAITATKDTLDAIVVPPAPPPPAPPVAAGGAA
jgi:hypothetical protein